MKRKMLYGLVALFMTACSNGSDDTTPNNPITPPVPTTGTINVSAFHA